MNSTVIRIARWAVLGALFLVPLIPLYVSGHLFFPYITGKGFAFRILMEVAISAYVLLACFDRKYRPQFSWTLLIFGAFAAWMAFADMLGVNPDKAFWSNFERMDGWVTFIHLFLLFIVAGTVLSADRLWKKWWLVNIAVSAIVCAYGLLQLAGLAEIHQGGVRADASFGNAIDLGVYLMFMLFITAWQAIESKGGLRYLLVALMAFQAVILIASSTRGAAIGLAAGVVVASGYWLVATRKDRKGGSMSIRIAAGVLVALALSIGGFYLARDSAFVKGDPALARLSTVFSLEGELKVRATIWGMALKGVAERPVVGWGQEGFNQVFNKYYEPSLYAQEAWFDRAHNMYIDWLVAGGIPALLLFLALMGSAFLALIRSRELSRVERVLLVGALSAYAVQAIVVFDNLWSYIPFVAILAMAHGASARPVKKLESLPVLKGQNSAAIALPVWIAFALLLVWTVNVPSIKAAHHLVYAISPLEQGPAANLEYFKRAIADKSFASQEIREQLSMFASSIAAKQEVPQALKSQIVTYALAQMGQEVAHSPNDARLRIQYAGLFDAIDDSKNGLAQTEAALALAPRKQMLYVKKGLELLALDRPTEAREALQTAYDLDRSFPDVAVTAAVGQIATGDVAGGKALLMTAIGTTTVDNDQLFYAYYQAKDFPDLILVAEARVTATKGAAEARFRLAQAYAAAGRFEEARREIVFAIAVHPEAKAAGEALMKQIFVPAR